MIEISKKLTPYNFTKMSNKENKYIVIHYVGDESTAKNNAEYFANNRLNASAHFFVDETSIWQSVEEFNKAWHCGGAFESNHHPMHNICTNSNSIGIEMCCYKDSGGNWRFKNQTVDNTVDLTRYIMKKYNIGISNVVRHYDVTGKSCPKPYVDETEWSEFRRKVMGNKIEEYTSANDIVWELVNRGIVTDKEGFLKELGNNTDSRLYWLARKAVQYIRERD